MSLRPPSVDETIEILERLDLQASRENAEMFRDAIVDSLELYEDLDALEEPSELKPAPMSEREASSVDKSTDDLNAWVYRCEVQETSDGPLAEYEVGLKDNISFAGIPMTCGSEALNGYVPEIDATVVTRLLNAGATITGTLSMDDFAFSGVGDTSTYGPMLNPHDPTRLAGGSSGGSAAAVANGDIDLTLGGDQGGSIRVPAAWCGCIGLKPTNGLVPYTGIFRVDNTLDVVGPLAMTVRDVARCLEVIAGEDPLDPRQGTVPPQSYTDALERDPEDLVIGVLEEGFAHDGIESAVKDAVLEAIVEYAAMGAEVVDVSIPLHLDALSVFLPLLVEGATATLRANGAGHGWEGYYDTRLVEEVGEIWESRTDKLPFNVKASVILGEYAKDEYDGMFYGKAQNLRRRFCQAYREAMAGIDVLALPTSPYRAFQYEPDATPAERFDDAIEPSRNTYPFNLTGQPAISVPCAKRDGLPVGLMLVGDHFDDATVLHAAHAFEQAVDWEQR